MKNLFEIFCSKDNLKLALHKSNKGQLKFKEDAIKFNTKLDLNISILLNDLKTLNYKHGFFKPMIVRDKKERIVWAPMYRDKLVHHMVNNVLKEIMEPKFIYDSYACIRNKGNQKAVLQLQNYFNLASNEYNDLYLLKLDISKFFYSINRDIMNDILNTVILDKRLYNICKIIVNAYQIEEKGLPLGNLTSQLFANIYLDVFDHYVKNELNIKYYIRYADDMFFLINNKSNAKIMKNKCIKFLKEKLDLDVNPTKVYIIKPNFIVGLGFKIYKNKIRVSQYGAKRLKEFIKQGKIKSLNSWIGHANIADIKALIYNYVNKYNRNISFKNNKFYRKYN